MISSDTLHIVSMAVFTVCIFVVMRFGARER